MLRHEPASSAVKPGMEVAATVVDSNLRHRARRRVRQVEVDIRLHSLSVASVDGKLTDPQRKFRNERRRAVPS